MAARCCSISFILSIVVVACSPYCLFAVYFFFQFFLSIYLFGYSRNLSRLSHLFGARFQNLDLQNSANIYADLSILVTDFVCALLRWNVGRSCYLLDGLVINTLQTYVQSIILFIINSLNRSASRAFSMFIRGKAISSTYKSGFYIFKHIQTTDSINIYIYALKKVAVATNFKLAFVCTGVHAQNVAAWGYFRRIISYFRNRFAKLFSFRIFEYSVFFSTYHIYCQWIFQIINSDNF